MRYITINFFSKFNDNTVYPPLKYVYDIGLRECTLDDIKDEL